MLRDAVDLAEDYTDMLEDELRKRPQCDCCGEHIQDDSYYKRGSEVLCWDCVKDLYSTEDGLW